MLDILLDVLIDGVKLIPFLLISYLIIELIEHKSSEKMEESLKKSGVLGPIIGSVLGIVPQCGFSVTASNLYAGRIISIGTLIAVYLSTSDEAIPIFLAHPESINKLFPILAIKFVVGLVFGILIDFILRKKHNVKEDVKELNDHIHGMCDSSHCNCKEHLVLSVLKHTLSTFIFILIISLVLNVTIYFIGEENLSKILMKDTFFQPFIASLIGLIPNCAASVLITELYLSGSISFASVIAGLLSGAGVGLAVLFKINKNMKENILILASIYAIGVLTGLLIQILHFFI